jgi:hypothetical protein
LQSGRVTAANISFLTDRKKRGDKHLYPFLLNKIKLLMTTDMVRRRPDKSAYKVNEKYMQDYGLKISSEETS